jgi:hypothetical protein
MWQNIRIKTDIYKMLKKQATAENRSVTNMLEVILLKIFK